MWTYVIKNLTHLYIKKIKFYLLFILNKILLTISYSFLTKEKCKDVNSLMFLVYK